MASQSDDPTDAKEERKSMDPALTPYELFAILVLATYLCAPALKKLFDPEIQRARKRVSRRRAVPVDASQESTQPAAPPHHAQGEMPQPSTHGTTSSEELRVALTRSCADALLAALRGGVEGAPKTDGAIDSKLAEALRPGHRTIRIEIDDSPLPRAPADEPSATAQRMFVVQSAAAGEVRVSSPWEYMSEPASRRGKTAPGTIWSAHSNFLGLRSVTPTLTSPSVEVAVADKHWPPKQAARQA